MRFFQILEHSRGLLWEFQFLMSVFIDMCEVYSADEIQHDMVRSTLLRHCSWGALRANLGCLILNVKNRRFWRLFATSDECFLCFQHSEHIEYVSLDFKRMFWSWVYIETYHNSRSLSRSAQLLSFQQQLISWDHMSQGEKHWVCVWSVALTTR